MMLEWMILNSPLEVGLLGPKIQTNVVGHWIEVICMKPTLNSNYHCEFPCNHHHSMEDWGAYCGIAFRVKIILARLIIYHGALFLPRPLLFFLFVNRLPNVSAWGFSQALHVDKMV